MERKEKVKKNKKERQTCNTWKNSRLYELLDFVIVILNILIQFNTKNRKHIIKKLSNNFITLQFSYLVIIGFFFFNSLYDFFSF